MLRDLHRADETWHIALLRYFNPVGAHASDRIGEAIPYIAEVAIGKRLELLVFGNDYPTPDGTGVRDYIHVVDLALGHFKALAKLAMASGVVTYNLGTGKGYSVFEMVSAYHSLNKVTTFHLISKQII